MPPTPPSRTILVAAVAWAAACPAATDAAATESAATDSATREQVAFFETKIRPIFVEHCWKCHAADAKGGLRLDARAMAIAGGDSGPAIVAGKPEESLVVRAVRYADAAYQMPPSGKLPAAAIRAIEEWVALGAPYPAGGDDPDPVPVRRGEFTVRDGDRDHWAYKPVVRPAVPPGGQAAPLDAFLDERLTARGLTANPPATPRELVRRAWFDLVGLPPPIEDVEAFERNPSDDAWRALVDRLLAMPAHGERWGRHWLDVVRYAQTNGYERDDEKPHAWRYRDWVIAAINEDMPYDRFVREQIAGDLLEPRVDSAVVATGFWHLGTWDDEPDDARMARYDELDDMISTVGQGFLGMTINCARCHDHKFDPLGQRDYYSLLGMVHAIRRYSPKHGLETRKNESGVEETVAGDSDAFARLSQGDGWALCAVDMKAPPRAHVLVRGNPGTPGAEVRPGIPEVLAGVVPTSASTDLPGRLGLAAWIASPANPLTARVMVNRIWLHHFGRGIVATPNDFGLSGAPPTDQRLLDWLAAEFVEHGWSVKHMHRVIMNSRAYRRSSATDRPDCLAADEGNDLLWRQSRRRLEAEAIRDAFLAAAGTLNTEAGGRGFFAALGRDSLAGQSKPGRGWELSEPRQQDRRSVYAFVKRTLLPPELEGFDYANTTSSVGERPVTTVSPQALLLTNGGFAREQAAALARRVAAELSGDSTAPGGRPAGDAAADGRFVTRAYEIALARRPSAAELEIALEYLVRQRSAWASAADSVALVPLVPSALVSEYRERLAPDRILTVAPAGWLVGGGVWGGGYEGILNLDPATGPFVLWIASGDRPPGAGFDAQGRFVDGAVEADLLIRNATELSALVMRGLAEGERLAQRFTGYELAFVPPLKSVELRRAGPQGHVVLAAARREIRPDAWTHVRLEVAGDRIAATLDHEAGPALVAVDPDPLRRAGHAGLRTWGARLDAREVVVRPSGGDAVRIDPDRPPPAEEVSRRADRDLCLLILNLNEFVYVD